MQRTRFVLGIWMVMAAVLSGACAPKQPAPAEVDPARAQEALSSFLGLLAGGDYGRAAEWYGGPLDALQSWNPEIDPQDIGGLLGYGCESRLLQCLPVRSVALAHRDDNELVFNVEFSLPDGTLFVRGACCGATSTEMPDQSIFVFRVQVKADGGYAVLDLPPYVP